MSHLPARQCSSPASAKAERGGGDQLERSEGMALGQGLQPLEQEAQLGAPGISLGPSRDPLAPASPKVGGRYEPQRKRSGG